MGVPEEAAEGWAPWTEEVMGWSLMEGPPLHRKPGPGALSKGVVWCVSSALGSVLGAVSVHDENFAEPLMSGQAITCPQPCSGRPGRP